MLHSNHIGIIMIFNKRDMPQMYRVGLDRIDSDDYNCKRLHEQQSMNDTQNSGHNSNEVDTSLGNSYCGVIFFVNMIQQKKNCMYIYGTCRMYFV